MGQASSSTPSSLPEFALHCLRVAENSPADGVLEPFFDYLIGVDADVNLTTGSVGDRAPLQVPTPTELARLLEENEGRELGLVVYNAKTQRVRDVKIIPSRRWEGGKDRVSLLGLSVRACNPAAALESVWHILEVLEGSPAEMAGLVPFGDWICGWAGGPMHGEGAFHELIETHVDKPLRLYVYSADLDNLREVVVIPNDKWGGSGLLGCGVGYGILHRIPAPASPQPRGESFFAAASPRASDAGRA